MQVDYIYIIYAYLLIITLKDNIMNLYFQINAVAITSTENGIFYNHYISSHLNNTGSNKNAVKINNSKIRLLHVYHALVLCEFKKYKSSVYYKKYKLNN